MRRFGSSFVFVVAVLAVCAAAPAGAAFGVHDFDVSFTGPEGAQSLQAGSHPFAMTVSFEANTVNEEGKEPEDAVKDLITKLPLGFAGNPDAVPHCSTPDFLSHPDSQILPLCSNSAAIGVIEVEVGTEEEGRSPYTTPVYNLETPPGVASKIGFLVAEIPVTVDVGISEEAPYRIVTPTRGISQVLQFYRAKLTLWGVPADPAHDGDRGRCVAEPGACPANIPNRPFLTLPRACTGPLATDYEVASWQNPGIWVSGSVLTHDDSFNPRGMNGCGKLGFSPEISTQPSTSQAESAAGVDFSIDVKDEGLINPTGLANADIEATEVAFPRGVTLNPSAAEGLGVCTKDQFAAEQLIDPLGEGCPDASKLGTLEAESPLLENHTIHGSLFLAQQDDPATPDPEAENPFDSLLAVYLVLRDPERGIFAKLAGETEADPVTGQIVTTVEDMPQVPISHVGLHLRQGPRAPFITPPTCGVYTTTAVLTPTSGTAPLTTTSSFKVDSGTGAGPCPAGGVPPFGPGFSAGSINNAAGAYSPFLLRLTRGDGEQDLTRFSAVLPPGISGKIAGIAKCSDVEIASAKQKTGRQEQATPSCPLSSKLGGVLAGAGVGTALTYVKGSLYLAGPFGGDPLSVVAIVPAVAGPFDVGTVVTRVALTLNQETGEVEVDGANSDPIPHILKGIPLKVRDIRVTTDRPDFTLNPTSCAKSASRATIFGGYADVFTPADDIAVRLSSPYQAASCASLKFKPALSLKLAGGTKRNDHPALRSVLTYPKGSGYANIGKAVVTLPPTEFIDNAHIQNPCTRVQFNAGNCPKGSRLGTARALTPLLDEPLEGPVYFRSNGGERLLPDIVADLNGVVRIVLVGHVDSKKGRIRTTFERVPDAPVTKFTLNLNGGKKGLLVNNRSLCRHKARATIELTGQNGRAYDTNPVVATSCKKLRSR